MLPVALSIAGSDPSGGAGIQADLKTFHQFGVYGEAIITLLTVQNTRRGGRVKVIAADLVAEQLEAVLEDIPPNAAKTGALGAAAIVRAVARCARSFRFPLVVDPVAVGKQGQALLDAQGMRALREELLPRAMLVTPNVPEAEGLSGIRILGPEELRRAAETIQRSGVGAVLIKGGHGKGPATDVLLAGGQFTEFPAPRLETRHSHGTGCTFSAAITAGLASGLELAAAVARAKGFIQEALRTAPELGQGCGPVNHHARIV
ncbi:MAG TPA: bifunctional hydroxymethylpyrimidine kinase/phosphomethylpyrimidine kinase [Bryobacteraceae bacterium]|jgi:hydroxymethylpyrimidine/phosphomethylpyrimidine kinase